MKSTARRSRGFQWIGVVMLAGIGLASCGGTTLREAWRDPQYTGGPLRKIAVFAVVRDDAVRRFAEDLVIRNLPAGTQAVAGYTIFPGLDVDKTAVRDRLVADGFDGALVARLVALLGERKVQAPQTQVAPQAPFFEGVGFYDPSSPTASLPDYYAHATRQATSPGYTVEASKVVVEVQLYTLPAGKPVWSGITDSMDPASREELVERISEVVGRRLRSEGLLGRP